MLRPLREQIELKKYHKEQSRAQSAVDWVLFCKIIYQTIDLKPLCGQKSVKFVVFYAKKSSLKQNRTDLSLVYNLNNSEYVFGPDLRNSAPYITQLFLNVEYVEYDNLCWLLNVEIY